jgi:2-dehydro-3-deoxyglucarate aldolase/4-hydroxy-2-oxoheptanedioate aldolase
VVHGAKYFPMGRRGFSSCSRANRQGIDALSLETMRRINGENLVMVQVESKKGMENVREIAQVDGIDILFLGLGDLSQDFGIPGQFGHPKIMGAIREFSGAVSEAGKTAGAPVSDPERIDEFVRLGFRLFSCGVDVILFKNALQHLIQNINSRVRA